MARRNPNIVVILWLFSILLEVRAFNFVNPPASETVTFTQGTTAEIRYVIDHYENYTIKLCQQTLADNSSTCSPDYIVDQTKYPTGIDRSYQWDVNIFPFSIDAGKQFFFTALLETDNSGNNVVSLAESNRSGGSGDINIQGSNIDETTIGNGDGSTIISGSNIDGSTIIGRNSGANGRKLTNGVIKGRSYDTENSCVESNFFNVVGQDAVPQSSNVGITTSSASPLEPWSSASPAISFPPLVLSSSTSSSAGLVTPVALSTFKLMTALSSQVQGSDSSIGSSAEFSQFSPMSTSTISTIATYRSVVSTTPLITTTSVADTTSRPASPGKSKKLKIGLSITVVFLFLSIVSFFAMNSRRKKKEKAQSAQNSSDVGPMLQNSLQLYGTRAELPTPFNVEKSARAINHEKAELP